ncbi:hypothetical protein HYV86_03620 [Candidatus Woesearchaeota archaeon]|nr:hypothetical protein [Candidatus Woesearchaeota archaeon]
MKLTHHFTSVAMYFSLTSCGPMPQFYNQRDFAQEQEQKATELPSFPESPTSQPSTEKPSQPTELGPDMLRLQEGYTAHKDLKAIIAELTVMYAGGFKVRKIQEGYYIEGNLNPFRYQHNIDSQLRMLHDADHDKDQIITMNEAQNLRDRLCKKYTKYPR